MIYENFFYNSNQKFYKTSNEIIEILLIPSVIDSVLKYRNVAAGSGQSKKKFNQLNYSHDKVER